MTQAPRPAATLILLRPGGDGVEVLMIQRAKSAAFLGGAYVFPGGALDAADSDLKRRILGGLPPEPPAEYYIAAVRGGKPTNTATGRPAIASPTRGAAQTSRVASAKAPIARKRITPNVRACPSRSAP